MWVFLPLQASARGRPHRHAPEAFTWGRSQEVVSESAFLSLPKRFLSVLFSIMGQVQATFQGILE